MTNFNIFKENLELIELSNKISSIGGRAFLVGGCIRDAILGFKSKDIDIEVFNITKDELLEILKQFGDIDTVGESFEVIKLTTFNQDFDISFPRKETKIGEGHKGFITEADPFMDPREAAKRRDFTINALMLDINTFQLFDFFNGLEDLHNGILKHTSDAFAEDPLRVLRAMQFASRFNLTLHPDTIELAKSLKSEFHTISKERLWIEFEKLLTKGQFPSKGIDVLFKTEWVKCFPSINERQNNKFSEELIKFISKDLDRVSKKSLAVSLAIFLKLTHLDKEQEFLNQINTPKEIQRKVIELLNMRDTMIGLPLDLPLRKKIKLVIGLNKKFVSLDEIKLFFNFESLFDINDDNIKPLVIGDDLIKFGWNPKIHKKAFGEELKRLFILQLQNDLSREELINQIIKF